MSYQLGSHTSCPTCKAAWESSCRCRIGHLECTNGHEWVNCPTHGPTPAYQPPDGSHAGCSKCAKKPPAEKAESRTTCGACKSLLESSGRHKIAYLACAEGHEWVGCRTHGITPVLRHPRGSYGACSRCAQTSLAEEDTSYWEVADPLRRLDMLASVGVDPYKTRRYRDCDWHELPFEIRSSLAGKLQMAEDGEVWDRTEARERRELMQQAKFPETEISPYLKTSWADLPEVMRVKLKPLFQNRNRIQQESKTCRLLRGLFEA